jgi:hypothetical protein
MHYCEIPDYKPVVLPLGGKQASHMRSLDVIVDKSLRRGN